MLDWLRSAEERAVRRQLATLREHLTIESEGEQRRKLQELARDVGASVVNLQIAKEAMVGELAHNIHVALQTQAMLATLRTTSNYVIATWMIAIATMALVVVTLSLS